MNPWEGLAQKEAPKLPAKSYPEKMTLTEVVEWLTDLHGGLLAAARATGIDAGYLVRIRQGKHPNLSDETLEKLGVRRLTVYERL